MRAKYPRLVPRDSRGCPGGGVSFTLIRCHAPSFLKSDGFNVRGAARHPCERGRAPDNVLPRDFGYAK